MFCFVSKVGTASETPTENPWPTNQALTTFCAVERKSLASELPFSFQIK